MDLESLLAENDKLRTEKLRLQEQLAAALQEVDAQRTEAARLRASVDRLEQQIRRYSTEVLEVERESGRLANLCVASARLRGTLERGEVLLAIQEVITNLIGCEEIGIFEIDHTGNQLALIAGMGVAAFNYPKITIGEGILGQAASDGQLYVELPREGADHDPSKPIVCIPLLANSQVTGLVAVFRLRTQKAAFEPIDYELFDVLARDAGAALYCASLHESRTVEG
jgi:hypothetical protein